MPTSRGMAGSRCATAGGCCGSTHSSCGRTLSGRAGRRSRRSGDGLVAIQLGTTGLAALAELAAEPLMARTLAMIGSVDMLHQGQHLRCHCIHHHTEGAACQRRSLTDLDAMPLEDSITKLDSVGEALVWAEPSQHDASTM
jgi:hypothetical protein